MNISPNSLLAGIVKSHTMEQSKALKKIEKCAQELKAAFYADRKKNLAASLEPRTPSKIWVVYTADAKNLDKSSFNTSIAKPENSVSFPVGYSLDIELDVFEIPTNQVLGKRRLSRNGIIVHGAFSDREIALAFQQFIAGSELFETAQMDTLHNELDKFRDLVLEGKRPYSILIKESEILDIRGIDSPYGKPLTLIQPLNYDSQYKSMSGTIWAWDLNDVTSQISELLNTLRYQIEISPLKHGET